jgi:elongation factor G
MSIVEPGKERNVGIVGHSGVGKTSLIEHILHDAKITNRLGTVEEGNTVCDYLEEEKDRKHTIALKLCHCTWHGDRIHLVDHPGYVDFAGELASSAPLLDGLIIVIDATTGVQVGTDLAWKYAERFNIPRAFFVNKLDREHTDFHAIVAALRETYGKRCVPYVIPVGASPNLSGVVNIFDGDAPADMAGEIAALKEAMADAVAETDDALLAKYLDTGAISPEEFHKGLHDGITAARIMPIVAGSVARNFGVDELLDIVADDFPSPLDRRVIARTPDEAEVEVPVSGDAPFLGQVFRNVVDPFVGHLTVFRVLTGTLKSDTEFLNVTRGVKERTGKLLLLNGKEQTPVDEVGPGDLAAMTKLKHTHFGDTIAAVGSNLHLPPIVLPPSMMKLAIEPKSRGDADKIGEALHHLAEEDPTFSHYRDEDTGELVVRGTGEMQLEIMLERLKRKYRVEAETRTPKVAFRETIKGRVEDVQGKHKKQTGGHGQYGDVHLRLYPNERGAGYKFVDSVVGGVVPRQYIPAVDKGAQEALARGVIAGFPVVDIVVDLHFGSYHDVDSSEMAFKVAASLAIREGVKKARPVILEPVMEIAVTTPEDCMGDITGDLNSRRGRILGVDAIGGGRQVIRALVPEAEVLRYASVLRSLTQGRGSFELKFAQYDEAPDTIARPLIEAYEKRRAEGE